MQSGFSKLQTLVVLVALVVAASVGYFMFYQPNTEAESPNPGEGDVVQAEKDRLYEIYKSVLTTCSKDNRSASDRAKQFDNYFKLNQSEDRAILRGCNDKDNLYAKIENGTWFPIFAINADAKQDNEMRKICKIEDITNGFDDTDRSKWTSKINDCFDVEAAYQRYFKKTDGVRP